MSLIYWIIPIVKHQQGEMITPYFFPFLYWLNIFSPNVHFSLGKYSSIWVYSIFRCFQVFSHYKEASKIFNLIFNVIFTCCNARKINKRLTVFFFIIIFLESMNKFLKMVENQASSSKINEEKLATYLEKIPILEFAYIKRQAFQTFSKYKKRDLILRYCETMKQ